MATSWLRPQARWFAAEDTQQLDEENYLRWENLGEFLALAASFGHFAIVKCDDKARVLSETLVEATGTFQLENKSPGRKLGTIDNHGSHFYLATYWAKEHAA